VIRSQGFYIEGQSWLYRLDPRVRLWYAGAVIAVCIISARIGLLAGALLLSHLVLAAGRVRLRAVITAWKALLSLVVVILLLQPLFVPQGEIVLEIGSLHITAKGLETGVLYALRMAASAFGLLVPLATCPASRLVRAFEQLGLPYRLGLVIGLALQYLGQLGSMYTSILEAQQARGLRLEGRNLMQRARAFIPTVVALVIAALRLSDNLALGLAARGFGVTGRKRTTLVQLVMRATDWLAAVGITLALAGAVLLSLPR